MRGALLACLVMSSSIFAQGYYKASADIRVKLINGAAFSIVAGKLNQRVSLEPAAGKIKINEDTKLRITGVNFGSVMIHCKYSEMHQSISGAEILDKINSIQDYNCFQTVIRKIDDNDNSCSVTLLSDNFITLNEKDNKGFDLLIMRNQNNRSLKSSEAVDGTLTISLIYD